MAGNIYHSAFNGGIVANDDGATERIRLADNTDNEHDRFRVVHDRHCESGISGDVSYYGFGSGRSGNEVVKPAVCH
jgi:hypothetical protein